VQYNRDPPLDAYCDERLEKESKCMNLLNLRFQIDGGSH
jgi:hypothetical protein